MRQGTHKIAAPVVLETNAVVQLTNATVLQLLAPVQMNAHQLALTGLGTVYFNSAAVADLAAVVVTNSATLGGNGVIGGAVTVCSGATLKPGLGGTDTSPLTVGGNLTLAAGGTTSIPIHRANTSRAATLAGIGTLARGGTPTVVNRGAALVAGDTFNLFGATNVTGSFTAGLRWWWLDRGNTLAVGSASQNRWATANVVSNGVVVLVHQGFAGFACALERATNLNAPVNWLPVVTNVVAPDGLLNFTNASPAPLNFFRTRYVP
ncbi:MAG: hypothetical protein NTZ16_15950 [Verrucomicrobia bacterium]|nr:hypothetical protein [Verrucomicrobiota bacterium]